MTNAMPEPRFGDLIKLPADGFEGAPDSPYPYHFASVEGMFIHRRLLIGRGAVKVTSMPSNYKKFGSNTGQFEFDAPPIPGTLISQIVHFFRRIFDKYGAEAAVLLTLHEETKEWGVFIPTQLVSHGGVNYVYDPSHIAGGRLVVGSIHSHCDFNPFHSGTDTGDAADFDGLHLTVGYVNRDAPGFVAMIAMNKTNLHYREADFPYVFDKTQLWETEAPAWWDQYVGKTGTQPVGFELYKKFEKPTEVKTHVVSTTNQWTQPKPTQSQPPTARGQHGLRLLPASTPSRDDQAARQMMSDWGIPGYGYGHTDYRTDRHKPWWMDKTHAELVESGYEWDPDLGSYRWVGSHNQSTPLTESKEFNARRAAERGVNWDNETGELRTHKLSQREANDLLAEMTEGDYWEDLLLQSAGEEIRDAILDTTSLNEDDYDDAMAHPTAAGDVSYWKELLFKKAIDTVATLRMMGLDISISLKSGDADDPKGQIEWLLPESPTTETSHGVH